MTLCYHWHIWHCATIDAYDILLPLIHMALCYHWHIWHCATIDTYDIVLPLTHTCMTLCYRWCIGLNLMLISYCTCHFQLFFLKIYSTSFSPAIMENIKNTLSNYNTYTCAIKLQRGVKMNLTLYYLQLWLLHHIHNSLTITSWTEWKIVASNFMLCVGLWLTTYCIYTKAHFQNCLT